MTDLLGLPPEAFAKQDQTPDALFYAQPRFVTHIDDAAIEAITDLYRTHLPPGGRILDLMSSWVSHLPVEAAYAAAIGHGLDERELAANPRLTQRFVLAPNSVMTQSIFALTDESAAVDFMQHSGTFQPNVFPRYCIHKLPKKLYAEWDLQMSTSNMNRVFRAFGSFGIILSIAGCQSPADTVDTHLTELNNSADNFRNQAILLNILRAEQSAPLSFVNVSSIPTQYNADLSAALPSFEVGPLKVQSGRPFTFNNTTLGTNFQSQTSPTFNNLIGKDFTQAATTGVSALQLLRLVRDGFSVDLVLALTVSRITIKYNRGFYSFDTFPTKLVDCPNINELSQREETTAAECMYRFRYRGAQLGVDFQAFEKNVPTKRTIAGQDDRSDKSTAEFSPTIDAKLCFNIPRNLNESTLSRLGIIESKGMRCSLENQSHKTEWLSADFRSLVGIYRFLGEYLRRTEIQRYYEPIPANGQTTEDIFGEPLLAVLKNYSGPCFVSASYQGDKYCVPLQGAYRTKAVFAILDQLQNNNTDISKIPQPSVVTLTGQLR